ncbi:MAG TPA: glycogen synthase [Elusimicrobiota bacterium]|nr:glycogen synthase [Elusimicrobiota bacterium]
MKALFLTNEYPPHVYGGAGIHVEYLSRELSRLMEMDVRCFGTQRARSPRLRVTGFPVLREIYAGCPSLLKSPLQSFERCVRFAARDTDADIVHCHTWYTHLGGILIKNCYGIPLVITTHSLEPLRPWKREQLGRGYDMSSWVEKQALESADALIAVSGSMKQDLLRLFDVESRRIHVIHNGIDPDEFRKCDPSPVIRRYGIRSPNVLFVGRITRQKGIRHLLNAIPSIDPRLQIVLCASSPDTPEIARETRAAIQKMNRGRNNIVWINEMVDKKTLIQLYSASTVFCCPSIYEPFGIINLEAMSCEVPVVASAVGGICEVVQPGKTGLLVKMAQHKTSPFEPVNPAGFSRDLASAINRVALTPGLAVRMGKAGRARVLDHFSWAAIAKRTHSLYHDLLRR